MQTFAKNGERPLYEQVREHLREQCLRDGADSALPSLRQMSDLLGVNHITISRALRELEAEGLLKIIPGKGTFIARPTETGTCVEMLTLYAHSHQRRQKTLADTSAHTLRGMQQGLQSNFSLAGTTLIVPPVPAADTLLPTFKARGVAAVAVFGFGYLDYPQSFEEARLIYELDRQMPVILIGKEHSLLQLDCIYCDPTLQMRTFLDECYERGMRRFSYFGRDDNLSHLRRRITSLQEFLLMHSLPMVQPTPDYNALSLEEGAIALLSMKDRPEVVVAPIPSVANHLVVAALRLGLVPGEDFHILCFAGSELEVELIAPHVNVVMLQEEEVGRCVIQRIHARLNNTDKAPPIVRRVPGRLVRQGQSLSD